MANQISANLYSQLDNEGRDILQFKGIIDHKKDGYALTKEIWFTVLKGVHKKCKPTTHGWKVLLEWKDETTSWMDLKDVKEASPIKLYECVVSNKIDYEPYYTI